MSYGMYLAAEGAQAQSKRLDVIANNMANVDTVGFKPDVAIFQARFAEAIQQGAVPETTRGMPGVGGGVKTLETRTDFSAGLLERTGDKSDLAIIGDGFLAVQGEGGEPLLTRAGSLQVDAQGRLVLAGSARPVLSADGSPIEIDPTVTDWEITREGNVRQGAQQTALALVRPESLDDLSKIGANLFRSRTEPAPVPAAEREVRAGYLEMSRSNPTRQLMAMIETQRAFEANTQMIRHQDQSTGSLISRVLSA